MKRKIKKERKYYPYGVPRPGKVVVACNFCGKEVYRYSRELNKSGVAYCSRACHNKGRTNIKTTKINTLEKVRQYFWSKVDKTPGQGPGGDCWIWIGSFRKSGYPSLHLSYFGKPMLAHRLSIILTKGELDPDLDVCHSCDNPPCVNPNHLWVGTHKDNMEDRSRKKRTRTKLSDELVYYIRYKWKESASVIAYRLNASASHINAIRRNITRKDITEDWVINLEQNDKYYQNYITLRNFIMDIYNLYKCSRYDKVEKIYELLSLVPEICT